jgi:DUF2934 family protein
MVTKPSSKGKLGRKAALAPSGERSPAIEPAGRLDERHIRERAYSIWIEEGRPHGRELAHWRQAHQELRREAP